MGSISNKKKSKKVNNFVSWIEIPAVNFDQAVRFYNYIFSIDMEKVKSNEYAMAFFPNKDGVGAAIVSGPSSIPSDTGPLVYLNVEEDLESVLHKIEEAGGRVIMNKTLISEESGYFAVFLDSEGNKLALHSEK